MSASYQGHKNPKMAKEVLNFKCPPTEPADLSLAEFSHTYCDVSEV